MTEGGDPKEEEEKKPEPEELKEEDKAEEAKEQKEEKDKATKELKARWSKAETDLKDCEDKWEKLREERNICVNLMFMACQNNPEFLANLTVSNEKDSLTSFIMTHCLFNDSVSSQEIEEEQLYQSSFTFLALLCKTENGLKWVKALKPNPFKRIFAIADSLKEAKKIRLFGLFLQKAGFTSDAMMENFTTELMDQL